MCLWRYDAIRMSAAAQHPYRRPRYLEHRKAPVGWT